MSNPDLELWVDDLLDEFASDSFAGSLLVRVIQDDDEDIRFEAANLDAHPADALVGYRAPASCIALGTVSGGWAAPMDGSTTRASAHPEAKRVFQVVLVDRLGVVAGRVRYPDGSMLRSAPTHGDVLDALRASLGIGSWNGRRLGAMVPPRPPLMNRAARRDRSRRSR
jgi:hypothetical protein